MEIKYYSRCFLNEEEGLAATSGKIVDYNPDVKYASFEITDCNRKVSLDFNFEKPEERSKAEYKINKLLEELNKFKEALLK